MGLYEGEGAGLYEGEGGGEGYFSHHDIIIQYTCTMFKLKEPCECNTVQNLV